MSNSPCWEVKNCGRERGGSHALDLGVCPAYSEDAGDACWLVAGTFCGGNVQGTYAEKEKNCMTCEVFRSYDLGHRSKTRQKFGIH